MRHQNFNISNETCNWYCKNDNTVSNLQNNEHLIYKKNTVQTSIMGSSCSKWTPTLDLYFMYLSKAVTVQYELGHLAKLERITI